ncbi:MAG: hypothetical protein NTW64_05595 [Candidatus Omnitrophica bacterium]|nr:hypothetical protein [Candidatus Omnitrophota bacterium]
MVKRVTILFLVLLLANFISVSLLHSSDYKGENIIYAIHPLGGRAVYTDLGMVELESRKLRLVTFTTDTLGFHDSEKIYCDPKTMLPFKVERNVSWWFGKEYIIEDYDQSNFTLTIKKFRGKRKINEQILKSNGPIYNAILLPLYPRSIPKLDIGWSFVFRLPQEFEVKLVSVDEIKIAGKKFNAYHFISNPDKFEIWINKDNPLEPLKIKGKGSFKYSLSMKEYDLKPQE